MSIIQAIILGLLQGLTEFLPVSSSGHIELGKAVLGVAAREDMAFTIVVHGATVLSTIVVFYKDILNLISDSMKFKWNESTRYILKIAVSIIPVGIAGVFFKDELEILFSGNIKFVGIMLLFTAILLATANYVKKKDKNVSFLNAFLIGIAQTIAILPGISRSGATIATGLLLGVKKEAVTRFSFLMVLIPIIGANAVEFTDASFNSDIDILPLTMGFFADFISGLFACKWMISIVKKGKLIYFAIYCLIIGIVAIMYG